MASQKFKLAVFDMDGVLTQPVSSWEYVHKRFGVDNTPNLNSYRAGTLAYIDFLKSDVQLWLDRNGTISADSVIQILDEIPTRDGINETMKQLREYGMRTVIISGGIYWLADKIGRIAGMNEIHANRIKTDKSNNITADGEVMVDPKHKDVVITDMQRRLGITAQETISIGDTFQDVAMFRHSALSIAFNPVDKTVAERATYSISGNDLTAILRLIE